jgi:hypothetical protein
VTDYDEVLRLRAILKVGVCPWCDSTKSWDSVLGHIAHAHGYSGREVRRMAGLAMSASVAAPSLALKTSAAAKKLNDSMTPEARKESARKAVGPRRPRERLAQNRAMHRLAQIHEAEFLRLVDEELARDMPIDQALGQSSNEENP